MASFATAIELSPRGVHTMHNFLDGAIMMAYLVAALCFLRFWKHTHDRFFLLFSLAFFIMAINRVSLTVMIPVRHAPEESHVVLYAVRLLAFGVLLLAIIDKNRSKPDSRGGLAASPGGSHGAGSA